MLSFNPPKSTKGLDALLDIESDSKHSIAKVISVRTQKICSQGHMPPMHAPLSAHGMCVGSFKHHQQVFVK